MSRSTFVGIVNDVSRIIWPDVLEHMRRRQTNDRRPSRRDWVQETVWALARHEYLRTPATNRLIALNRLYFSETDERTADQLEDEMYDALKALDREHAKILSTAP